MRKQKKTRLPILLGIGLGLWVCTMGKAEAATLLENPNISWSPDGQAFTTDAGEIFYTAYDYGTEVYPGGESSLQKLQEGQHYYVDEKQGTIPIASWEVRKTPGECIHKHDKVPGEDDHHGLDYGNQTCQRDYKPGWIGICADCGEEIRLLFYMEKETAQSLSEISTLYDYYYLCPHCGNLEQGADIEHDCKLVSWNQYTVVYRQGGLDVQGSIPKSTFMYNNETVYEGEPITPATRLSKCTYFREGYEFTGWNTKPDGSGEAFADEQEIFNLTKEEGAEIILYARWEKCESELYIDPNGGCFAGNYFTTYEKQGCGSTFSVASSLVTPPEGNRISFESNGGSVVEERVTEKYFRNWQRSQPFHGILEGETYSFGRVNGATDRLTARYGDLPLTLPGCSKEGAAFGGWYKDADCTLPAGKAGEAVVFLEDTVLYAKWVDLQLTATEDYSVNGGAGAVDLSWVQTDGAGKTYRLYQSTDNKTWKSLSFGGGGETVSLEEVFSATGKEESYTVPYSGLYTLTAAGAQGGDYESHRGGLGGQVTARVWLSKGEVLTYRIGTQSGYPNGGTGAAFGNGGGMTAITSDRKGLLLIAGGGGGATSREDGGAGGLAESLVEDTSPGESGGAGGGGGYPGGSAGEVEIHHHDGNCFHTETGSAPALFYQNAAWSYSSNNWAQYFRAEETGARVGSNSDGGKANAANPAVLTMTLSKENFVPTPGEGELTFTLKSGYSQNVSTEPLPRYYVWVYDKDTEQLLHYTDLDAVSYTETGKEKYWYCDRGENCPTPWYNHYLYKYTWYYENEFVTGERKWNPWETWTKHATGANGELLYDGYSSWDDFEMHVTVPIPEETEGVYIQVETRAHAAGDTSFYYGVRVEDVAYQRTLQTCGYPEGYVLLNEPAFGGSNYVNTAYCSLVEDLAGMQEGDGLLVLTLPEAEYVDGLTLRDVAAPDQAPPEAVDRESIGKMALSGTRVKITWDAPRDKGTDYYHRAESYDAVIGEKLCDSNVTLNHLCSGIKGYYYVVDGCPDTRIEPGMEEPGMEASGMEEAAFVTSNALELTMTEEVQYLHLSAADVAGNVSGTIHIRIGRADPEVSWNIVTGQIRITDTEENLFPAGEEEKTWYVRADGKTPFALSFPAALDREALADYQINYLEFDVTESGSGRTQRHQTFTPSRPLAEGVFSSGIGELRQSVRGELLLEDGSYTVTTRSNVCRDLQILQHFLLPQAFDGQTLSIVPVAGAVRRINTGETGSETGDVTGDTSIAYSDWEKDTLNGIRIIGDGRPPAVEGTEALEQMLAGNREAADLSLDLTCSDEGSGIRAFYVTVENRDTYRTKTFPAEADGHIRLDLAEEEEEVFAGDFVLTIHAIDNVGNDAALTYRAEQFSLTASVTRMREPHAPVLQKGEYGILHITATGYVDMVTVEMLDPIFPAEVVFTYNLPEKEQTEEVEFKVPLDATEGQYGIVVHAYKDGRRLDAVPVLGVFEVSGTILDDFRRKILWMK